MPSLFRFLTLVGVLGGLTYGALPFAATARSGLCANCQGDRDGDSRGFGSNQLESMNKAP